MSSHIDFVFTNTHIWLLFTWISIVLVGLIRCWWYRFGTLTQHVQDILEQPSKIAKHVDILKYVGIHDSDDMYFDVSVLRSVMTKYPYLINFINSTDPQVYCKLYQINHDILNHMSSISEPIALALIKLDYKCLPTILTKIDVTPEFLVKAVQTDAHSILQIPTSLLTQSIYETAVTNHHVLCLLVADDPSVVKHVKNMTNGLCIKLWHINPQVLDHVEVNDDLLLNLIGLDYKTFKHVRVRTLDFCKRAIEVDARVITLIDNPPDSFYKHAITHLIKQDQLG